MASSDEEMAGTLLGDGQGIGGSPDPKQAICSSFCRIFGRGTGPRGEKMAVACWGTDSQDLATILDPFRVIFADLGPDRLSAT